MSKAKIRVFSLLPLPFKPCPFLTWRDSPPLLSCHSPKSIWTVSQQKKQKHISLRVITSHSIMTIIHKYKYSVVFIPNIFRWTHFKWIWATISKQSIADVYYYFNYHSVCWIHLGYLSWLCALSYFFLRNVIWAFVMQTNSRTQQQPNNNKKIWLFVF